MGARPSPVRPGPAAGPLARFLLALAATAILLACGLGSNARAAEPGEKDRLEARKLGAEGLSLFEAQRYEAALERFEQANEHFPAPTLGLRAARCLTELGRLVEASERYLEVGRFPLTRRSPRVHYAARRQARKERDQLMPQIPTLRVDVPDVSADSIVVRVDGERVPAGLVGQPQPVDPGRHEVEVRRGAQSVRSKAELKKGEHTVLVLQIPGAAEVREAEQAAASEDSSHRLWGLIALHAGGVGAIVGLVHGVSALAQYDNLEARCPDGACPPEAQDERDLYDVTRAFTTVGLVLGGVGLGVGTTLLLVDPGAVPDGDDRAAVQIEPWVGPGSAGLRGSF